MRSLDIIDRGVAALALTVAWTMLLVMIGTRCFDIIAGQFMTTPSGLLSAFENRAFTFLVLFAIAYAYSAQAHVRVDVLRERFSARTRSWIEIAGGLTALLPLSVLVVWLSIPAIQNDYEVGARAWVLLGVPYEWLIKSALPLAFGILGLAGLTTIIRHLLFLTGRGPDPASAQR